MTTPVRCDEEPWREVLGELADLMDDVASGGYKPDSFTTQPARILLATLPARSGVREALERLHDRISTRLNNVLCEMKPGYDDSVTGFNEAWAIVSTTIKAALSQLPTTDDARREKIVQECLAAARDGFEKAMEQYALIGPSGMAMMMLNSIRALSDLTATTRVKSHD